MGENKNLPMIAGGLVVVALIVGVISYQFLPKSSTPTAVVTKEDEERHAWLKQKSIECQGDGSKLSPEDQKKCAGYVGANYVNMVMAAQYKMAQGKK